MALTSLTNLQPLHVHSVGVSTFDGSVSVGGTLTYEDVTNVDAIGIVTARSGVNVSGGQLDVGSNIKLGNAGVITATSFVGNIVGGVTGNISIPESIVHTGDTNTRIAFIADETISFDTNGSEKLRITGAGSLITSNIGLGTDNRWKIRPNNSNQELTFEYSTSTSLADSNIKFRLGSAGQFGIGNAVNYGSSGQVLTSGGASGAASWSTLTGTTINNNADNRVITGSGSANTLEGESNLTFNGTKLSLTPPANTGNDGLEIIPAGGSTASSFKVKGNQSAGVAAGRNGGVVEIDANYYVPTSDIFTIKSRGAVVLNMLGSGVLQIKEPAGGAADGASMNFIFGNNNSTDVISSIIFSNNVGEVARIQGETRNGNTNGMITFHSDISGTSAERMRVNHDGAFCFGSDLGRPAEFHQPDGFSIRWDDKGQFQNSVSNTTGGYMNRKGSDGGILSFARQGTYVGEIGVNASTMYLNFGGTNAEAHQLDDYEEGSYTPNVQTDNGVNCGMAVAQGYYVKVGKVVTVHLKIQTNSHNSVNTAAQYKVSLPYTSQSVGDTQGTLMCSIWSIGTSNISWMGGQVHNNNAWTHLAYHNGNNNNTNNLQPNVANNQLQFRGTVVYRSNS